MSLAFQIDFTVIHENEESSQVKIKRQGERLALSKGRISPCHARGLWQLQRGWAAALPAWYMGSLQLQQGDGRVTSCGGTEVPSLILHRSSRTGQI